MTAAVGTRRAAWRTTWLLLGFMLINFADKTVLGLAATPMMRDLGITHAQYGEASSAFFALFSLSALGVSVLAKRVRSTTLLLLMALLWSAAQLPLLTAVIDNLGWHWAFGLVGLGGLAWAACWARFGTEGPEPVRSGTDPQPTGAAADAGTPEVPLRRILLTGTWIAAALTCFAAYWQLSSGLTWTADYLENGLGVSTGETGVLIMGAGLTSASVLLGYGFLAQRLRRRGASLRRLALLCGAAMVVSGGSVAVFGTTSSLPLKIALMLGPMTLCNVVLAMAQTACARIAPPRQRGVVLGALAFVYSLAGVLSPLVVGRLTTGAAPLVDGYRTGYLITAVLLTGAGLVALVLLRPERDAAGLGLPAEPTAAPALPVRAV